MTPQQIEALKLALECAERCEAIDGMYSWSATITAIKEVLAEHAMRETQRLGQEIEQESVTTLEDLEQEIYENTRQFVSHDVMEWMLKRYYTTPPQRKPLTVQEMFEAIRPLYSSEKDARIAVDISEDEYRAIEAAHGIKENT